MASHGGIVGALLGFLLWARKSGADGWAVADNAAVFAPVGIFLGRMANFINGELWGKASNVPWAVIFPDAGSQPRHPSQIYEALGEGLLLGVVMLWCRSRNPRPTGLVISAFFIVYGAVRIGLETFREPDLGDPLFCGLSRGQWFSIVLLLVGLGIGIGRARFAGAPAVRKN
jgi:phosphatidylglycerol:prolipoprotein diacylglycerol transferase